VDYATADGSATAGLKYAATNGTLAFAAGQTNQAIVVPILNDWLVGSTKYFRVALSNPTNAVLGTRTNPTVYITDNDKGLQFEFADYWAREDEGSVLIGVARADDGDFPVSVDFATSNLTATNGLDYAATNGTLSFAAGEMTKSFAVPVFDEGVAEPDEQFKVRLSNPSGGLALGTATNATVTLCDTTEMQPHRFDSIRVSPEGVVSLTLGGGYTPGVGLVNRAVWSDLWVESWAKRASRHRPQSGAS
jgi:hypothetical protein